MYKPSALNLWKPGFPEFLKFATLTCSPWRWVLVAPSKLAPEGFVNVQTGETRTRWSGDAYAAGSIRGTSHRRRRHRRETLGDCR